MTATTGRTVLIIGASRMLTLFQCSSIAMIFTLMSSRRISADLTHRLLSQPYTIHSTTVEWICE